MKPWLQNLGDYEILEKLGRGGMADVYLALDRTKNLRVALKLVEHGEDADAREILEAERLGAELQQRISEADPRVPRIHGYGDLEGFFFIDMEYVEGSDLSELIASGVLKPEDAARIALELCSILRIAHGMSLKIGGRELRAVIHGDIKPKNIRIDTTGKVRVLDFGIAKGLSITRRLTSNVFGSVAYSSPERLESGSIDEMSDLWAVGVVLYEMVESRLPFEAGSTERLESIIKSRNPVRPLQDSCPVALQQIIYKALADSPSGRYRNAAEFEADLQAFLSGNPTLAAREIEETRRTVPADDETRRMAAETGAPADDETRRTVVTVVPPAPAAESPAGTRFGQIKDLLVHRKKWIWAGLAAVIAMLGIWEGTVMHAAGQMKPEFVQERLDGDRAWSRYEQIRERSPLNLAPLILRDPLRQLLIGHCERICTEYRNSDTLRIREGDWARCRRNMTRALQLGPGDRKLEAMEEYAKGHVLRINRKSFEAVAAFERAASLNSKWADPYLGLARTYIYSLNDMDRGARALEQAREKGHSFGKRDLAMMAEARRKRGLKDLENADLLQGTDQEKEFLKRAKEEFKGALESYLQIAPYGDSTEQIQTLQNRLAEIDLRLDELNKPNPLLPWTWFK